MTDNDASRQGLERAIAAAGGPKALADALGCSRTAISNWRAEGGLPASRIPSVARVTGLPPEALRPDLFGRPNPRPGFAEAQQRLEPEARALGLDPAAIAEKALREAVGREKARRWAEENKAAIEAHTRYIEEHDTPLAKYRMF